MGLLEGEYDRSIVNIPFSMEAEETSKALSRLNAQFRDKSTDK